MSRKLVKIFQCLGQVNVWEMQTTSQPSLRYSCTQTWHTHSNNTDREVLIFLAMPWFETAWRNCQNITIECLEFFREFLKYLGFFDVFMQCPDSFLKLFQTRTIQDNPNFPCLFYWSEYVMFLSFLGKGDLKSNRNVFSISQAFF